MAEMEEVPMEGEEETEPTPQEKAEVCWVQG
jgi:hypothetical protein